MKRFNFLLSMVLISTLIFAQGEQKTYFSKIDLGVSGGKNNSGAKEKFLDLNARGVYGWLYWQIARGQVGKKFRTGQNFEKLTTATLGYGKQLGLSQNLNLIVGGGPSIIIIPQYNSFPKRNNFFYGGSASGILEGENLEASLSGTYSFLPPNSSYDWNNALVLAKAEGIYFLGDVVGLGVSYEFKMVTNTEKQIPGNQFNGYVYNNQKTILSPFVSFKTGPAIFKFGPEIKRDKYSNSQLYQPVQFNAHNSPMGYTLGVILTFKG